MTVTGHRAPASNTGAKSDVYDCFVGELKTTKSNTYFFFIYDLQRTIYFFMPAVKAGMSPLPGGR